MHFIIRSIIFWLLLLLHLKIFDQILKSDCILYLKGINIKKYNIFLIVCFAGLFIISLQPFLLVSMENELAYHMIVEHSIFFLLGAISVNVAEMILKALVIYQRKQKKTLYQIQNNIISRSIYGWSFFLRNIFKTKRIGYIWIIVSILILGFWHLPFIFDYSEMHPIVHMMQHISFIFVGVTGFLSIRALGESYQIFLILVLSGMMGFVGLIFSILDNSIYTVYSITGHNYAGTAMVIVSIILLVVALPSFAIKKTISYAKTKI
jgi:hypothetical protein